MIDDFPVLSKYISNNFDSIEGWCSAPLFTFLSEVQLYFNKNKLVGSNYEIGVHHGKLLLGLHNLNPTVSTVGMDLFDLQRLNFDKSGCGNRIVTEKNIAQYAANPHKIDLLEVDSLSLNMKRIIELENSYGLAQYFSIDGGHSVENTMNDFMIAQELIGIGGVVMVDDYFSPRWPGVHEGVTRCFYSNKSKLVPFSIMYNKVLFAQPSFHMELFKLILTTSRKIGKTALELKLLNSPVVFIKP